MVSAYNLTAQLLAASVDRHISNEEWRKLFVEGIESLDIGVDMEKEPDRTAFALMGSGNWGKSQYLRRNELVTAAEMDAYFEKTAAAGYPKDFLDAMIVRVALEEGNDGVNPYANVTLPSPAPSCPSAPEDFVPPLDDLRKRMASMRISDWA